MGWVSNVCHLLFNCSSSSTPPLSSLSDFVPSVLPSMDVAFIPNFGSRSTEITEVVDCYGLTPPLILGKGGRMAAINLESRAALLAAEQVMHREILVLIRSIMVLLGPMLWGTLLADIVIQMLGTDYARILRAIYAFPQVAGDGLSVNIPRMSKNQLYDIMSQMKNQDQARQILIQNPLLTKALLQTYSWFLILLQQINVYGSIPNPQVIVSWNGLVVSSYARASKILMNEPDVTKFNFHVAGIDDEVFPNKTRGGYFNTTGEYENDTLLLNSTYLSTCAIYLGSRHDMLLEKLIYDVCNYYPTLAESLKAFARSEECYIAFILCYLVCKKACSGFGFREEVVYLHSDGEDNDDDETGSDSELISAQNNFGFITASQSQSSSIDPWPQTYRFSSFISSIDH
ncbi:unnamed protein product [Lactuca saligna]|uniref:Cleavage stimulation factor subunit 2 hinge domain-containing protein n=1 Tax=Lactuca saligna TaxID=75948 RepID=A0AA35Z5A8_LACSI|nr:unnamed protein product [Lactuca saligna]